MAELTRTPAGGRVRASSPLGRMASRLDAAGIPDAGVIRSWSEEEDGEMTSSLSTCPKCSSAVRAGAARCISCGVSLEGTIPAAAPSAPAPPPAMRPPRAFSDAPPPAAQAGVGQPLPLRTRPVAPSECRLCRQAGPLANRPFRQNIGALVVHFASQVDGPLCRRCTNRTFVQTTGITTLVGWIGMKSLILAPIFVVMNVGNYAAARRDFARQARGAGTSAQA
jgi:hypothetical protein